MDLNHFLAAIVRLREPRDPLWSQRALASICYPVTSLHLEIARCAFSCARTNVAQQKVVSHVHREGINSHKRSTGKATTSALKNERRHRFPSREGNEGGICYPQVSMFRLLFASGVSNQRQYSWPGLLVSWSFCSPNVSTQLTLNKKN